MNNIIPNINKRRESFKHIERTYKKFRVTIGSGFLGDLSQNKHTSRMHNSPTLLLVMKIDKCGKDEDGDAYFEHDAHDDDDYDDDGGSADGNDGATMIALMMDGAGAET